MTLIAILAGTLAAGIGSVWLAAALSFGVLARYTTHMLSLAAGALLATAFMHLLPEAFESQAGAHELFATLLVGLVFFFLLDKAELYHHGHEHHDPQGEKKEDLGYVLAPVRTENSVAAEHVETAPAPLARHHHHGHSHNHSHNHGVRSGSWAVLTGDSVHAFGDGILIASAFVADIRLGVITALAVLAHEIPHHMGDLVVLRQTSSNQRIALVKVSLAGAVTAIGGLIGYALVDMLHNWLPYFLVVASSSFVYVALADLIPQLQKRLSASETFAQIAWLAVGIALVTVVSGLAH
jgi:zinc and cadmium transporter